MKIDILYQDQYLAVINKPSGLLSVPYPGSKGHTALSMLEDSMRKNGTWKSSHHPFAVHRLDRDTSGVMMFALTEIAQKKIMDTWHTMVKSRLYHAVAENPNYENDNIENQPVLPDTGMIDAPLTQNAHHVGYVTKKNTESKKDKTMVARTHYKVLLRGKTHTLFELNLDTGKKNQIRAHLSSIGYPLAGDVEFRAKTDPFNRLALHARTLSFIHPFTNEKLSFDIPEPTNWLTVVEKGDITVLKSRKISENTKTQEGRSNREKESLSLGKRRPSRKNLAHTDFITRGKSFSTKK